MLRWIWLGMAIQAIIAAALIRIKAINPTPGQQFIAGLLFLALSAYAFTFKK